jgi:hypothetical protein
VRTEVVRLRDGWVVELGKNRELALQFVDLLLQERAVVQEFEREIFVQIGIADNSVTIVALWRSPRIK